MVRRPQIGGEESALFEFEMMLKGLVCFGNPVNHPGPMTGKEPAVSRDFREEIGIARNIVRRAVEAGHKLMEIEDSPFAFQRYLESIIAQDGSGFQAVKHSLDQDTPEQKLTLLVSAFENILDVLDGLMSLERVPYRLFSATVQMAQREIHRSLYFDPLAALEFRPEFDRIRSTELLNVVRNIESDPARRVVTLSFLALYRLLHYIDIISNYDPNGPDADPLYGWLAVFRSDARAVVIFLKRDVSKWIAGGFGKLYEQSKPTAIEESYDQIVSEYKDLRSIKDLMVSMGDQLRLEQRKAFEHHLPDLRSAESPEKLARQAELAGGALRAFLQNAVVLLAHRIGLDADGERLFRDFVSARVQSERLRRDIWMLQQVLRAFIEKAKDSAETSDKWSGRNTFRFVREFVRYFRSMGYQILRYSDYEKFDQFIALVDRLREGDVLEVQRIPKVIAECEDFNEFLGKTFEAISQRKDLDGVSFDRKDAAKTLKLFLRR